MNEFEQEIERLVRERAEQIAQSYWQEQWAYVKHCAPIPYPPATPHVIVTPDGKPWE